MQLVRLGMLLIAAAAGVGQYLQERFRLSIIQKLPGAEARARYEALRRRSERTMIVIAVVATAIGVVALADLVTGGRFGR